VRWPPCTRARPAKPRNRGFSVLIAANLVANVIRFGLFRLLGVRRHPAAGTAGRAEDQPAPAGPRSPFGKNCPAESHDDPRGENPLMRDHSISRHAIGSRPQRPEAGLRRVLRGAGHRSQLARPAMFGLARTHRVLYLWNVTRTAGE